MSDILLLLQNPFPLFLSGLFWADFCTVCLGLCLIYLLVSRQSKNILEKNIAYNRGLFAFRAEVYANYEKNFFV